MTGNIVPHGERLNLNTAPREDLKQIKGISDTLAGKLTLDHISAS